MTDDRIFYCFVNFEPEHPVVHVIPAAVVADVVRVGYQTWLDTSGRNGRPHSATKMRRVLRRQAGMPEEWMDPYLEAWDQFL